MFNTYQVKCKSAGVKIIISTTKLLKYEKFYKQKKVGGGGCVSTKEMDESKEFLKNQNKVQAAVIGKICLSPNAVATMFFVNDLENWQMALKFK
ncbi:hypothetical protein T4D_863 [Trichinella pseudospiralis]|uniref:Uncharacterized protein n=1 Tax=Trichinella pseudospiralis TaxID=6337 RepID=A0A0V1G2E5_TRIPS|nr:hypothetical protein T4D_863 [Trichinella pseudospiralis]